jgi:hypothetical protein
MLCMLGVKGFNRPTLWHPYSLTKASSPLSGLRKRRYLLVCGCIFFLILYYKKQWEVDSCNLMPSDRLQKWLVAASGGFLSKSVFATSVNCGKLLYDVRYHFVRGWMLFWLPARKYPTITGWGMVKTRTFWTIRSQSQGWPRFRD